MIFPKGEVVHQNLSTEYTDVPELLSTLTSNGFAGYVEIDLSQQKGAFLIRKGQVLGAVIEPDADLTTHFGQESIDKLLNLTNKEIGVLNIYKLPSAQVDAIVAKFRAEIVFKGLTTDFVKLDKFIQKLSLERHTGFIEVFSKENIFMGTLFLKNGELVDLHLISGTDNSPVSEPEAISVFLEDAIRQGALFDVYRSLVENIPSAVPENEAGQLADSTEVKRTEVTEAEAVLQPDNIISEAFEQSIEEGDDESNTEFSQNGRNEALDLLQDAIAKIEKFVDGFSREGIFNRAFKRALIEKSEDYPFLDPFTDQFDYRQGKIMLDEDVELEQFALGIADSINLSLSHLKKEFPKNMNLSTIRTELESTFRQYEDAMKRSGIQSMPQVFLK